MLFYVLAIGNYYAGSNIGVPLDTRIPENGYIC